MLDHEHWGAYTGITAHFFQTPKLRLKNALVSLMFFVVVSTLFSNAENRHKCVWIMSTGEHMQGLAHTIY